MSAHTKGPWIAAAAGSSIVGWPVVATSGRSICSVTWTPKSAIGNGFTAADWETFNEECRANAKLIAAAPKMLAALQKICEPITVAADAETLIACQDLHELISEIAQEAIDDAVLP